MKCVNVFGAFIFIIITLLINEYNCKLYSRCELARELKRQGFDRSFLSNWVCLVENESGRNADKITDINSLHSNYGLFQISSKDYCNKITKGGLCSAKCNDLIGDNVREAARCAKLIFARNGFKAWRGWELYCKQKPMPEISHCFTI